MRAFAVVPRLAFGMPARLFLCMAQKRQAPYPEHITMQAGRYAIRIAKEIMRYK